MRLAVIVLAVLLSGCVLYEKRDGFSNTIVTFP